jgi:hypothetical protein
MRSGGACGNAKKGIGIIVLAGARASNQSAAIAD